MRVSKQKKAGSFTYTPTILNTKNIKLLPDSKEILKIKEQIESKDNTKLQSYRENRLPIKQSLFGRYSKSLFNTSHGIIYGKQGMYAIYNESKKQFHLGKGGFGNIKLAKNLDTNKWYVLKTIQVESKKHLDSVKQEHQILKLLGLSNEELMLRKSLKSEKPSCKANIIMKYIKGLDIYELMLHKLEPFDDLHYVNETFWLHVAFKIICELEILHSKNIIHGDIKRENIIYDIASDKAQIIDFGGSFQKYVFKNNQLHEQTRPIRYALTSVNVAPEITSKAKFSKKSDIYALSFVLEGLIFNKVAQNRLNSNESSPKPTSTNKLVQLQKSEFDGEGFTPLRNFIASMRHPDPLRRPTTCEVKRYFLAILNCLQKKPISSYWYTPHHSVSEITSRYAKYEAAKQYEVCGNKERSENQITRRATV